jgi:hypothetical protein
LLPVFHSFALSSPFLLFLVAFGCLLGGYFCQLPARLLDLVLEKALIFSYLLKRASSEAATGVRIDFLIHDEYVRKKSVFYKSLKRRLT